MRAGAVSGLAKAVLIVLGGLAVSLLLWDVSNRDENRVEHHLQFERSTDWDKDTVRDCLKSGNGSKIFADFILVETWFGAPGAVEPLMYKNHDGSTLVIEPEGGGTKIRFKSSNKPSEEQQDLLEWCVNNPQLTWIAPQYRSRSE